MKLPPASGQPFSIIWTAGRSVPWGWPLQGCAGLLAGGQREIRMSRPAPSGPPHLVRVITDRTASTQSDGQPQLEGTCVAIWPRGLQTLRRGRDLPSNEIRSSKNRCRRVERGRKSLGAPELCRALWQLEQNGRFLELPGHTDGN